MSRCRQRKKEASSAESNPKPISIRKETKVKTDDKEAEVHVEVVLQYNDTYNDQVLCYTNTIHNPDGGTHPDPAKACAALDAHPEALHPVPGDVACTEIYGGDQVALVEGNGMRAVLNRTNGCEIARWDALAPVLELPG